MKTTYTIDIVRSRGALAIFFLKNPLGQLLTLAIIWVIWRVCQMLFKKRLPKTVVTLDIMAPFLLIGSLLLSHVGDRPPLLPWIVIIWMFGAIGIALRQAFRNGEILYGTFFKSFWRWSDIVLLVMYVIIWTMHVI